MLKKLYTLIILALIMSMVVAGWISYNALKNYNEDSNQDKLKTAINFAFSKVETAEDYEQINQSIQSIFDFDKEKIRLTFINSEGTVLYDNEADAALMDNHRYRQEVYRTLDTKNYEFSVRRSDTLNTDIYYSAYYREDLNLVVRAAISLSDYQSSINDVVLWIIWILFIGLIVLILVGIIAVNQITKPLTQIEKAAMEFSAGNYDKRVFLSGNLDDEVYKVARSFNYMADELQLVVNAQKKENLKLDTVLNSVGSCIAGVNENLELTFLNQSGEDEFFDSNYDISKKYNLVSIIRSNELENSVKEALAIKENKTIQTQIETKKGNKIFKGIISPIIGNKGMDAIITLHDVTEVNKLQKLRSEFVANVTHELKTPLTSIRGFIETLKEGAINNPEVNGKFIDIIDLEAARLHTLITDVLSISELENQYTDTDIEEFNLNVLIDETTVLLDDEASKKKVSIISVLDENNIDVFLVKANKNRIKQILINLVENAIRYNNEGGKIYINAVRNKKGEVEISVEDTGNGISKEHLPRLFERFYRVDKARSKASGSTGLGLSIVKHIAMLYNGTVNVESELGKGSRFTVKLKI